MEILGIEKFEKFHFLGRSSVKKFLCSPHMKALSQRVPNSFLSQGILGDNGQGEEYA